MLLVSTALVPLTAFISHFTGNCTSAFLYHLTYCIRCGVRALLETGIYLQNSMCRSNSLVILITTDIYNFALAGWIFGTDLQFLHSHGSRR